MASVTNNHTKLDRQLERTWSKINSELSRSDVKLLLCYDSEMVNTSLGKATRLKHIQVLLSISRILNKNWSRVTKHDISNLIRTIMDRYGYDSGAESDTSRDFKKVLKIFFRW